MPLRETARDEYPTWIGLIFVFNLIVGTGALTLPAAFAKAGWALGSVIIVFLAFISYITVTFIIETIACANAVLHWKRLHMFKNDKVINDNDLSNSQNDDFHNELTDDESIEETPLFSQQNLRYYVLDNKTELGEMATLFFNSFGRILFYICTVIYLYGDLSIYSAAVSKSIRDVICDKYNSSFNENDLENVPCLESHTITRLDCYRLTLIGFSMCVGPFAFFNVTKTKYIQILTIILRWLAFTIMISIAIHRLFINGNQGNPPPANFSGVPNLFGTCVYSFMCHHSLPSIITPINNKKRIKTLLSFDYILICSFYLFLAITGALAFLNLNDLYTLNFITNNGNDNGNIFLKFIEYFLALFPVFTLLTSFPIIAITLRNNLQTLFLDQNRINTCNFFVRKLLFPLLAILPPIFVTYFTDSIKSLVGFTGSYAGTGIQYLIPISLVYFGRKTCTSLLGFGIVNEFASPFKSNLWLLFVLLWSVTCVIFVTANLFL